MNCGQCGHQPPAGSTFCNSCGAKLVTTCASCGATPPPGSRFCNGCGAPLSEKAKVKRQKSKIETDPRPLTPDPQGEAEACFLKAIEIAQKQQAKSLELRTVMSLVRLRQSQALEQGAGSREQGEKSKESGVKSQEQDARMELAEAHTMLSDLYHWFTEGFDTKDLRETKALLEELSEL